MTVESGGTEPEVDEGDIPKEPVYLNSFVEVTPDSAIVDTSINSPVGSGPIVYADFGTAVWNAWAIGLEWPYQDEGAPRLMGEAAPPELRAGRRAFKALLDRYEAAGYTPDMADELSTICDTYCSDYGVVVSAVLPHDLEKVLDMAYPDDYGYDEDEEDEEEEQDELLAGAPPRDEFDLDNPQHLEWLQKALEYLADL